MIGKNINEEEFDELIYDNEEQSLILFHKQDCNACHEALRQLEALEDIEGWTFAKVDAVKEKNLFSRFRLNGVPQVLLFQDGQLIRTLSGTKTLSEYHSALKFFEVPEQNISHSQENCCSDICYFADKI